MAKEKIRISKTGTTGSGRIALYTNSKEVSDLDPAIVRFIPGNSLSPLFLNSTGLEDDFISSDELIEDDGAKGDEGGSGDEGGEGAKVPSSSDITIVSQNIVYDKDNRPSVTVVFKVKNSSGVELKGINARIELV
jgi:hypothetical protein